MALYRNIAGFNPNGQIGLNLLTAFTPTTTSTSTTTPQTGGGLTIIDPSTVQILPPGTQWSGTSVDVKANEQQYIDAFAALEADQKARYNYLLSTSPFDLTQQGYYVTPDGYVWVYTDSAHTNSVIYLQLDTIQGIENAAGTAGTLFMHMNLPLLAKDSAGYGGGYLASQGATVMYSTPIAEVLAIPSAPTGPNVIETYTPPETTIPGSTTPPTTTPTTTTTQPTTTVMSVNTVGFVALGLAAIGIARSKKLLLIGGLGLLYYSMNKNKIV